MLKEVCSFAQGVFDPSFKTYKAFFTFLQSFAHSLSLGQISVTMLFASSVQASKGKKDR